MKQCFVISPIGEKGSEIRNHANNVFDFIIEPAMKECGIYAFRSDQLTKPGRISEQMIQCIYNSDLCIAVLTNYNPNVFYELAIAESAQRPVIILIESGQKLPFDISDLRCVYYDPDIRSYSEKTHINQIINFVREFEADEWKVPDLFGICREQPKPEKREIEFFEKSSDYGSESAWISLLESAKDTFDIMGIGLWSWRNNRNFEEAVIQKAKEGCKIRILLMNTDNPVLKSLNYLYGMTYEDAIYEIDRNFTFYDNLSKKCEHVEVRRISSGLPYFFLTLNEEYALLILYLSTQTWGAGPLLKFSKEFKFYNIAKNEFENLWKLSKQLPKSEP